MTEVDIYFELLEEVHGVPPGWKKVTIHLIWDVNIDFTWKASWVLDGHKTPNPVVSTCAGVVSRGSVHIEFTYEVINRIEVLTSDIQNAYLQAPSSQKDYIIYETEFGIERIGRIALTQKALYSGKSAGKDFRNHLRSCMKHLNLVSKLDEPDVWMRPAKHSNISD